MGRYREKESTAAAAAVAIDSKKITVLEAYSKIFYDLKCLRLDADEEQDDNVQSEQDEDDEDGEVMEQYLEENNSSERQLFISVAELLAPLNTYGDP